MKNKLRILSFCVCMLLSLSVFSLQTKAADTDEIANYTITVEVNDDATLDITYHIDWMVLESDSVGALEWVQIGTPNNHGWNYTALSDNIAQIVMDENRGCYARIDFKDRYYEGDMVSFDFTITQDYMYQVNKLEDGYTVYEFTPGWFDDIQVDELKIYWENDKAYSWSPSCEVDDGFNVWKTSLKKGEKFTVSMTYPNDAFAFDMSKTIEVAEAANDEISDEEAIAVIFGIMGFVIAVGAVGGAVNSARYKNSANLGAQYDTKITRTKIVYFPECPGCGAARQEGEQKCVYCGRSLVQSEEVLKEDKIKGEDKEAVKYKTEGIYQYSSSPNTYVHVHVDRVKRPTPPPTTRSHSSCAHSSCACACACACAGGGRAGCSMKDYYRTDLKLRYFKKRQKNH